MLTPKEIKFLRYLFPGRGLECKDPVSEEFKSLVERGYCKLLPGLTGPLGLQDGSTIILLTEAGKQLVIYLDQRCLYPGELFSDDR